MFGLLAVLTVAVMFGGAGAIVIGFTILEWIDGTARGYR